MQTIRPYLLVLFLVIGSGQLWAQFNEERDNSGKVLLPTISYGYYIPQGDLSNRFGTLNELGLSLSLLTEKGFEFGIDGTFFFGREVKEDVLAALRGPDGSIIGNTRSIANVELRMRGFYTGLYLGKLFPLSKDYNKSGILTRLHVGLFQHKIRVQDDPESFVPQLDDEYKKGYDRLSNGLAIKEFIGYQFLSRNRLINFFAGIEMMQGFTQSRRDFNFDTRTMEDESRLDLTFGFRAGWTLPFYIGQNTEEIYY
ncbi:MAG: hypothetical protein AAFP19_11330, partial [Bacteroidota bacterium]